MLEMLPMWSNVQPQLQPHPCRMKISKIGTQDLIKYFAEAHSSFLYGFRIARAVLCRAILETALKEEFDTDGRIERKMNKALGKSHTSRSWWR